MELINYNEKYKEITTEMIMGFFNHHRILNNAPSEYWCTLDDAKKDLDEWINNSELKLIIIDHKLVGFINYRLGGQNVAWLEDIYVIDEYRGKGLGKLVMDEFKREMTSRGVVSIFVDVIPRNEMALDFYIDSGFDHLNMIQLRKNIDKSLDKQDDVVLLGRTIRKY